MMSCNRAEARLRHFSPDRKKSQITTRPPALVNSRTMLDPMNPAPPVTRIRSSPEKFRTTGMISFLDYEMCIVDRDSLESSTRRVYRAFYDNSGNHRPSNRVQQRKELLQLVQSGISDVDNVFVFNGKSLGKKIRIGVAEIETVDDGGTAVGPGC